MYSTNTALPCRPQALGTPKPPLQPQWRKAGWPLPLGFSGPLTRGLKGAFIPK